MKIKVVGDVIENEDGSATVNLELDDEAKQRLIQVGFETLIMRDLPEKEI